MSQPALRRGWAGAGNVLLVVLVTALQVAALRSGSPGHVPDLLAGPTGAILGTAAALIQGVALLWRHSRPVSVLEVCVVGYAVNAAVVPGVPPYAGWVALYAAGVYGHGGRRGVYWAVAGAAALVLIFGVSALAYPKARGELLVVIAVTVTAALLAAVVRSRRAQLDALRDRAAALERERVSATARAAAEERLRIARDVHDLVGHGLSGIAVQSSTARLALEAGKVELARAALSSVEASSRAALGEMRQLLGVLRPGTTSELGRAPGLADLADLVGRAHGQGVTVTLRAGELSEVPGAVSLAAYRVVQEALTNVVKHGGGSRATVQVNASGSAVLVTVDDYADPAAPPATTGPLAPPGRAARPAGGQAGGIGLAGMRERVALLGGELSAGPAGDHPGWRVQARIPYGTEDAG